MEMKTREEAIAHAIEGWTRKLAQSQQDMTIEEFANQTIADIDAEGWDEDIHGDITLEMEAWARDTWDGTPWE